MNSITVIGYMKDPQDVNRPGAPAYPVINGADGEPYDAGLGSLLSLLGRSDGTLEGIAREAQAEKEVLAALLALLTRRWYDGARTVDRLFWDALPATVDSIRKQITYLEGELSRLSGKPILIRDGMNGGTTYADTPPVGALLDYETGIAEQAYQQWYPNLEAAKAALLLLQRQHHGELSESGLHLDAAPIRAYITRRDSLPTLWVVNPMLDTGNTVDVYLDRDEALARCEVHESLRGVRCSPGRVRPGDAAYERLSKLIK